LEKLLLLTSRIWKFVILIKGSRFHLVILFLLIVRGFDVKQTVWF
jgi:hypothetical protein